MIRSFSCSSSFSLFGGLFRRALECLQPKFSKNYPTLLEKFKNQADFAKNGKKLLDFLLHALYN